MSGRITEFQGQWRWLSNFWSVSPYLIYDGHQYITAEHAYQAAKCNLESERQKIASAETPGVAKRFGKEVMLRDDWEDIKLQVMKLILIEKFKNKELRKKLLNTGSAVLEEGNKWNDRFWGIDIRSGNGENWLGRLLMEVRDNIKKGG